MKTLLYVLFRVIASIFLLQFSCLIYAQTDILDAESNFELRQNGDLLEILDKASGESIFDLRSGQCLSLNYERADYNQDGIADIFIRCTNNVPREYVLFVNDSLRIGQTISANQIDLAPDGLFTFDRKSIPDDNWSSTLYLVGENGVLNSAFKLSRSRGQFLMWDFKNGIAVQQIGKLKEFLRNYLDFEEDVGGFLKWFWGRWRGDSGSFNNKSDE